MGVATALTVVLQGATGHLVDVQTDVSPGQVGVTVVGRPDTMLHESRERCRMALVNSGLPWPSTQRVTILLSPADLHKQGTHLDLAIAVSVLAAETKGELRPDLLHGALFLGELSLDGRLRPCAGVLPMVLAAARRGVRTVYVPEPQAQEAAMVPDVEVIGVRSLAQVVALLRGASPVEVPDAPPVAEPSGAQVLAWRGADRAASLDLADLAGVSDARYALEVAAAGGHHLLMQGPKGSGKTSLAERLPGLLPDLTPEESVEVTALHSLAGTLDPHRGFFVRPPFSAPHHDASKAAVVGGGLGQVRPGELSRTHLGVLFLDEFPFFRADVLEALRQPLENGEITIARRDEMVTLPARGLLVLAANPCPCGEYRRDQGSSRCTCSQAVRRAYQQRVSGPLADRIDITRQVEGHRPHELHDPLRRPEPTAGVRVRVERARHRQAERYGGLGWRLNAHAPGPAIRAGWPVERDAQALIDQQTYAGHLSARGVVRVHRLAWTVADLLEDPPERPGRAEVEVALALRSGDPLPVAALTGVAR